MSKEGKLFRGLKFYHLRDRDGNLPQGIVNSEKMNDVNAYLEFVKGKDAAEVSGILQKLSLMGRTSQKRLPAYRKLLDELDSLGGK